MSALMTVESVGSIAAYESMCRSIADCESRAECKDIADKSKALEEYAKRINNTDAERRAVNIRMVAERRYGELLKELARAQPTGGNLGNQHTGGRPAPVAAPPSPYREAITRDGIRERKAQRLQALADVPKAVFDEAIRDPGEKPTTARLLAKAQAMRTVNEARDPVPKMPSDTLWLWGRLNDFERDGFFQKPLPELLEPMTDAMRADVVRIAPLMTEFFTRLEEVNHELA